VSTHLEFAKKMLKWYKYHLEFHLPNKDKYKDLEEFIQADEITAADEFEAFNINSATSEDFIMMDNAICNQLELRRCMNERDIPIDVYWDRWQRYLTLEQRELDKFKDEIEAKHAFIKGTSKGIRKKVIQYHGHGQQFFDAVHVDYLNGNGGKSSAVEPDDGKPRKA